MLATVLSKGTKKKSKFLFLLTNTESSVETFGSRFATKPSFVGSGFFGIVSLVVPPNVGLDGSSGLVFGNISIGFEKVGANVSCA